MKWLKKLSCRKWDKRGRKSSLKGNRSTAPAIHPLLSFCFDCVAVIDLGQSEKGQFTSDPDNQPIPLREQTETHGGWGKERESEAVKRQKWERRKVKEYKKIDRGRQSPRKQVRRAKTCQAGSLVLACKTISCEQGKIGNCLILMFESSLLILKRLSFPHISAHVETSKEYHIIWASLNLLNQPNNRMGAVKYGWSINMYCIGRLWWASWQHVTWVSFHSTRGMIG